MEAGDHNANYPIRHLDGAMQERRGEFELYEVSSPLSAVTLARRNPLLNGH